jgi:hypothetical protein
MARLAVACGFLSVLLACGAHGPHVEDVPDASVAPPREDAGRADDGGYGDGGHPGSVDAGVPDGGAAPKLWLVRLDGADAAAQVVLEVRSALDGRLLQEKRLPARDFTISALGTYEGALGRSDDRAYLMLGGRGPDGRMVVARVDPRASVDLSTTAGSGLVGPFSDAARAVGSADGRVYWVATALSGLLRVEHGADGGAPAFTRVRTLNAVVVRDGRVLVGTGSTGGWNDAGVFEVRAGERVVLPGMPGPGRAPHGFEVMRTGDDAERGLQAWVVTAGPEGSARGIERYVLEGGHWRGAGLVPGSEGQGCLHVAVVPGDRPTVFCTTRSALVHFGEVPSQSSPRVVATAGPGASYRGLSLGPEPGG